MIEIKKLNKFMIKTRINNLNTNKITFQITKNI